MTDHPGSPLESTTSIGDTSAHESLGGSIEIVEVADTTFTLLAPPPVSPASVEEVTGLIRSGRFDAVALELCPSRHRQLQRPDEFIDHDLFEVFRQGKAGMVAASLALSSFQRRIKERSGVAPGAEMKAALNEAEAASLPVQLIDREIGITLKRAYHQIPQWQRIILLSGLLRSIISHREIGQEQIEHLKQGDALASSFDEFTQQSARLSTALIDERDRYMALRLAEENPPRAGETPSNVLVVIGAGHLKGLGAALRASTGEPDEDARAALEQTSARSRRWRVLPWLMITLLLGSIVFGFVQSPALGWQLIAEWVVINALTAALFCALARAHPLTILFSALISPFSSFNPLISAGLLCAGVELALRRPKIGDFSRLREDASHLSGWWRNGVARILLVFMFTTAGSAIGGWIASFRIAGQLL